MAAGDAGWSAATRRITAVERAFALVVLAGSAAVILWADRFFDFWFDEWSVILYRRSGGLDALFAPHNGHLFLTTHLLYRGLFALVGLAHYWPYQAVLVATHIAAGALTYLYVRRRVPAVCALVATSAFLLLGYAWQVVLWPIETQGTLPVIALLGILLLRDRRSKWHEWATGGLLLFGLVTAGLGIAVFGGVAVEKLLARDRITQWWSVFVPGALYGLWFIAIRPIVLPPTALRSIPGADANGDVNAFGFDRSNWRSVPADVLRLARAAIVALFSSPPDRYGVIAVAVAAVAIAAIIVRRPPLARFAVFGTVAAVYWTTIAVARGQFGELDRLTSSRYLYVGALCVLLMLVELFAHARPRRWATAVVLGIGILVLRHDLVVLGHYRDSSEAAFAALHDDERAVIDNRSYVDPNALVSPALLPDVRAGPFLAAVDDLGAPQPDAEGSSRRDGFAAMGLGGGAVVVAHAGWARFRRRRQPDDAQDPSVEAGSKLKT